MDWTTQQAGALSSVRKWLRDRHAPQVFRLFGWAGTGKSTLAMHIAADVNGLVCYCAYTGKAALVMRKKGCIGATTIHSLIYKVEDGEDGAPHFIFDPDSPASLAAIIIVDEVSMADEEIGRDLLRFGKKVLVLGDPFQLPPVKGEGFFTAAEPDIMLTDIRRQAADNPIIRLSIDVREGRRLTCGLYGDSKVIQRHQLNRDEVLEADQVLVGMNKTRTTFNARIRELTGFTGLIPQPRDRLICLKNNREKGLINGSMWEAASVLDLGGKVEMRVKSLDGMPDPGEVVTPIEFFTGREKELEWWQRKEADEFDFSYAITVHKSQGSQFDNVMLFDESGVFRENRARHLYTGLTRAAERITVVV